jgi:hypothetical protein
MNKLPFENLQDIQINHSLLSVTEEKKDIIPADIDFSQDFSGLDKKMVLVSPALYSITTDVIGLLNKRGCLLKDELKTGSKDFKNEVALLEYLENQMENNEQIPDRVDIITKAVLPGGLLSYWNALRVIAYHTFKNRKIIQKGSEIIPIKTPKQFEYHFHHNLNSENQQHINPDADEKPIVYTSLCFDGSKAEVFEAFYEYVLKRIQGKLERQIKRKELIPLLTWRIRFKDELTIFFKAKVGGKGYASDYQDAKVREIQRKEKKVKGLNAAELVKNAFLDVINTADFSHQEYTCMIARNRGYSSTAISRFTGIKAKAVDQIILGAIPKASQIIYRVFCQKMNEVETKKGLQITESLVRKILLSESEKE